MGETNWIPAISVLAAGLGAGAALALFARLRARHRASAPQTAGDAAPPLAGDVSQDSPVLDSNGEYDDTRQATIADLRSRRDQLLEQLRELQDTSLGDGGSAERIAERDRLERETALVLRELSYAEAGSTADVAPPRATGTPDRSLRAAEWRGALKGALVVGLVGAMAVALWQGVQPRSEGMGMTGNTPPGPMGEGAAAGGMNAEEGHPTDSNGRPIVAQQTPRLQSAREAVRANPDSLDALIELGYALAEAGGWIELHETSRKILARDANNSEGLIQAAMVRAAMHQPEHAGQLIDSVLAHDPENVRALEVGGRIALHSGDWSRAVGLLERALPKIGPGKGIEALIARAKENAAKQPNGSASATAVSSARTPVLAARATGAPSQQAASSGQAGASGAISGTVRLAEGVHAPDGGVLFVIARAAGVTAGPPAAVVRLPVTGFPVPFRIDQSNAMMGGALPPELSISARVDMDGNAATRQAGDLAGVSTRGVHLGSDNAEIVLRPIGNGS